MVPGIDFSEDPLLQGRLFSYLDTQLTRLGSANFHQIPINAPKCPFANFQRDGHMQMLVPKGRANYEPNSIDPSGPRESPTAGFQTAPVPVDGAKVRLRAESFADHYSQARLFYRSMTAHEQKHMQKALTFELGKVAVEEVRRKILGHLDVIDKDFGAIVAEELGMEGEAIAATPAIQPVDLPPSPALRIIGKYPPTLKGRKVGIVLAPGFDATVLKALMAAIEAEKAACAIIGTKVGGVMDSAGKKHAVDMALNASPSIFFDAVVMLAGPDGDSRLAQVPDAVQFLRDAFRHLKAIGLSGVPQTAQRAEIVAQLGVTDFASGKDGISNFIDFAKGGRVWDRDSD